VVAVVLDIATHTAVVAALADTAVVEVVPVGQA